MTKDFINISDFSADQIGGLLDRALAEKAAFRAGKLPATLPRKTLAMIFEKQSLRTRLSFAVAMTQLGGQSINLAPQDIGLGTREPVRDVARVVGRMCDGIMARTFSHEMVEELARHAAVPVVNGLTDYSHPCQAMADLLTLAEEFGDLAGRTIVFVGDGNNVARSLAGACGLLRMKFVLSSPVGYELEEAFVSTLPEGTYELRHDPKAAVADADAVYADTWISMGQEEQREKRVRDFAGYQLDDALMAAAPKHAVVLHCLPAYRGYEITDEVLEAHAETVFRQAENRLHFQRCLLNVLIGEGGIR